MAALGLMAEPGALLLAAYLYFIGGGAALTAFFTAVLAHELGHLIAMGLFGAELRRLRLTAAGPVIEYGGALTPGQEAWVVAAGPIGGVLLAALCFCLGTPYFHYAGLIALLGSAFNLLPAYPMDGGRLAWLLLQNTAPERYAAAAMLALGVTVGAGVAALGILWRAPVIGAAGIFLVANAVKLRYNTGYGYE